MTVTLACGHVLHNVCLQSYMSRRSLTMEEACPLKCGASAASGAASAASGAALTIDVDMLPAPDAVDATAFDAPDDAEEEALLRLFEHA